MTDMHDARVEAACKAYQAAQNEDPYDFKGRMSAAIAAADAVCCAHPKCPGGSLCCCQSDAVVTEEMIAETILKALVFTNENSKPWADGVARDIAALSRGGAK